MNREEQLVYEYLMSMGYENIIFEPDGNIPPDFIVDGTIAIEVRRLNQYIKNSNEIEQVEKLGFTISSMIDKTINEIDISNYDQSAFLLVRYKRPLTISKQTKNKIKAILKVHLSDLSQRRIYQIQENLEVEVFPIEDKLETVYRFGSLTDEDAGGFIVSLIYQNMKEVIKEKEKKIEKYRDKYQEWCLALVDTIGYGMNSGDVVQFNKLPKLDNDFNKVLLIPPLRPQDGIILIE